MRASSPSLNHSLRLKLLIPGAYLLIFLFAAACSPDPRKPSSATAPEIVLFHPVPIEQSGLDFVPTLPEDKFRNILRYQYYYNGGGVAVGDVNGDGLPDLCFSLNTEAPRLYLNQGAMTFEPAPDNGGIRLPSPNSWSTGISMLDVNADGWLDIYLCRSGNLRPENRRNLLFVNQQDGTFREAAATYGLDDEGYSVQAAVLDYDADGDLDLFLTNHGINFYGRDPQQRATNDQDPLTGDKLYRNDGGRFTDVSRAAGILQRSLSYGLGVGIGDLNQDGLDDIYVSNDFFEPDYLYWNQGDGTFREGIREAAPQLSYFGMGNDLSDVNNDGLLDIMVVDMMPADHYRRHTNLAGISYDKFLEFLDKGYHRQYMFNTLHLNMGKGQFRNHAWLAGVAQTDWSWAPLFCDLDNDGHKDLYITNGLRKDVLNLDFINNLNTKLAALNKPELELTDAQFREFLGDMPSERIANYAFHNDGDLRFADKTAAWGLAQPSFSNGAVYADLDRDGDLDLVVNNLADPPFLFENRARQETENHYLALELKGPPQNPLALGAKVWVRSEQGGQYQQLYAARGFQSSVEPIIHFGLGPDSLAAVRVRWPDGQETLINRVAADRRLSLDYNSLQKRPAEKEEPFPPLFADITARVGLQHRHRENAFDDFRREFLLPHRLSDLGPDLAVGDVDGDGREDFYVGGAAGSAGTLFRQQPDEQFEILPGPWTEDAACEDVGTLLFDADGDGDLDLYVASGGGVFDPDSPQYQDRLYVNDGAGGFQKASDALPVLHQSASCVRAGDLDQDGDLDLFIGGRHRPGAYPLPAGSTILRNAGGRFEDVTAELLPELADIGMVTDARWSDFDGDGRQDLILCGEWMTVRFFRNTGKELTEVTDQTGLSHLSGWYFSLAEGDFDSDGDIDYVAGNLGLNQRFQASEDEPLEAFAKDFDDNGQVDLVLAYSREGKSWPFYGRNVLGEQMPEIKKTFPDYAGYAQATVRELFPPGALSDALHLQADNFASVYIENQGEGRFAATPLPRAAQASAIQAMVPADFNADGRLDLLVAGNMFGVEFRSPRADASLGYLLLGYGNGRFLPVPPRESGLFAGGDVRSMASIRLGTQPALLIGKNDDRLQLISWGLPDENNNVQ